MWQFRRSYAGVDARAMNATRGAWSVVAGIARVLDALFGILYMLLGVRLVLDFLQARKDSGFYELIGRLSDPFYAPFKDIVRNGSLDATHPIVWSLIIAMLAYALLHAALRGLLRLAIRGA